MATSAWLQAFTQSRLHALKFPISFRTPARHFSSSPRAFSSVDRRKITLKTPATPFLTKITIQSNLDDTARELSFPNLLLRDSSQHPAHIHPDSRQKLYRTSDIPLQGEIISNELVVDAAGVGCLKLEWSTPIEGMQLPDAVTSLYPLAWIESAAQLGVESSRLPPATTWTNATLLPTLSATIFNDYITDPARRLAHVDSLVKNGIAFLNEMPVKAGADGVAPLKRAAEAVGTVRHTWYGELWDVKAEEGSKNIAYTNLDLGLHMDLTHFESPPRYQYLQCLNNTAITGGESYFVDSFHVAKVLRESHPAAYKILCTEPMLFEYKNGGQHTRWNRPTIELSPAEPGQDDSARTPWAVNYSPPFQGQLNFFPDNSTEGTILRSTEQLHALHAALKLFASLCDSLEMQYRVQMQPGDCVVFDNRRVLHARTSFEFNDYEPKEGEERGRWLKGAYMDGDEVWSQWRVAEALRLKALETPMSEK